MASRLRNGSGLAVAAPLRADAVAPQLSVLDQLRPASATGVGSLPHRHARQAADFALAGFELPAIPTLPRRSPAESFVARALVGVTGVTLGQYGTVAVDVDRLDVAAPVETDFGGDQCVGFRTFLEVASAQGYIGPIKWQFVGPISLGVALVRAGAAPALAFDVACAVVRSHLRALVDAVAAALPNSSQLVILDEPFARGLMNGDFPIPVGVAIDCLSGAMAAVEPLVTVGVHSCGHADVATLLESGPRVISVPAHESLVPLAGYLDRFLANDGWIAWGVVPTEGPMGASANRSWNHLSSVWEGLAQQGVDDERLRHQSLLTPDCGLGNLTPLVAHDMCGVLRDVSQRVRTESVRRFASLV